ncbi:MAG: Npun_R2821/Npun_R2822 family protein [Acidobacteriota bacterium]
MSAPQSVDAVYTLANDRVADQLTALLASVQHLYGDRMPVWVIPFDDQLREVRQALDAFPFASLWADTESLERWDRFMASVRPECLDPRRTRIYGGHRKLAAFDGEARRFVFMDADTLLMDRLDAIGSALDHKDFVACDFQHRHAQHVFDPESPLTASLFGPDWRQRVFCSGFFAGHAGAFPAQRLDELETRLLAGEKQLFRRGGPDQPLINYLVARGELEVVNLALTESPYRGVGSWAGSPHFEREGKRLLDRGRVLLYLHWVGYPSADFRQLCRGRDVDLPYRDLFLAHRFSDGQGPPGWTEPRHLLRSLWRSVRARA